MIVPVILSGGAGTRLWPLSREQYPKQLLPLVGELTMLQETVARLGPGYAYDAAFKEPLHSATEFSWLENRQGWVRVRLPDASEGWLRQSACMQVR